MRIVDVSFIRPVADPRQGTIGTHLKGVKRLRPKDDLEFVQTHTGVAICKKRREGFQETFVEVPYANIESIVWEGDFSDLTGAPDLPEPAE